MEEIMKDIAELESLQAQSQRHRVKNLLSTEIRKLQAEVDQLKNAEMSKAQSTSTPTMHPKRYQIKLNNYAWDQTSKFVKFYVTLQKVQSLPSENVVCNFTKKSLELQVKDLDNKDYVFIINNLLNEIDSAKSSYKVKSDMILINAAKVEQKNWEFVTEVEKRTSEAKKLPKFSDDNKTDPSEGIMNLMKNMYDQGDDEMKRTIAKAWHESCSKNPSF